MRLAKMRFQQARLSFGRRNEAAVAVTLPKRLFGDAPAADAPNGTGKFKANGFPDKLIHIYFTIESR
jgi:hypothetical protein